jgi:hypothetical protein
MDLFESIIEGLLEGLEEAGSWGAVLFILLVLALLLLGVHVLHHL